MSETKKVTEIIIKLSFAFFLKEQKNTPTFIIWNMLAKT